MTDAPRGEAEGPLEGGPRTPATETAAARAASLRAAAIAGLPLRFVGTGWSMWPLVGEGDLAHFSPFGEGEPSPHRGDVLLYLCDDTLIAHRFIGQHADGAYRLRGDACRDDDPPVLPELIIGRLLRVDRHFGRGLGVAVASLLPVLHLGADGVAMRAAAAVLPVLSEHAPTLIAALQQRARGVARGAQRLLGRRPARALTPPEAPPSVTRP